VDDDEEEHEEAAHRHQDLSAYGIGEDLHGTIPFSVIFPDAPFFDARDFGILPRGGPGGARHSLNVCIICS
jgi:hypothetical protein